MVLSQLIEFLETLDLDTVWNTSLCDPRPYRCDYYSVAFSPGPSQSTKDILNTVKNTVGRVFTGHSGGEFEMRLDSDCYILGEHCDVFGAKINQAILYALRELPRGFIPYV